MNKDYSMNTNSPISYLRKGGDNAVSMVALSRYTDSTPREVRECIMNARLSGFIICSNKKGYFIPETEEELVVWYRTMTTRVKTTLAILKWVESYLDGEEESDND